MRACELARTSCTLHMLHHYFDVDDRHVVAVVVGECADFDDVGCRLLELVALLVLIDEDRVCGVNMDRFHGWSVPFLCLVRVQCGLTPARARNARVVGTLRSQIAVVAVGLGSARCVLTRRTAV